MKKLLVAFVGSCAFGAFANEWYIDPTNGVDTATGTEAAPRKTLKGAMEIPDLAAGDTIWLLPGEYAEETMGEFNTRRLYIDKPNLRFRSTAGRDRTFIVGQHDGSKKYDGDNAVGCVTIAKNATGCIFEGITFKDGAARYRDLADDDSSGAGIRDLSRSCWVIGCRFTNCVAYATAGGMVGGNVSGTEFVGCKASGGSSSCAQGLTYAEFCLFRDGSANGLLDYGGTFVNCTFYGNDIKNSKMLYRKTFKLYNCLAYGFTLSCGSYEKNATDLTGYVTITNTFLNIYEDNGSVSVGANSLTNADEWTVRFVSPAKGDFRLTDISDAKELGDAAYLALRPDTFPEGFVRRDVYGIPVTTTSGAIPAGCALEVPHQTVGRVGFSDSYASFEVQELGCTFASGDYFNPIREDYTYMFRPVTDRHVISISVAGLDGKEYFFPLRQKGGWTPVGVLMDPYSTNVFTTVSANTTQVYYADPNNGSDDYDGKSSNVVDSTTGPFKTLMGAMAKLDKGTAGTVKVLYLMPGTYAEGQTAAATTSTKVEGVTGVCYRVCIGTINSMAIVGLEGSEKTFIVGAPDPDTGGIGPKATGGVWLKSGTCRVVQGVTITGCYSTDLDSDSYLVAGCAFFGGGSTTTFCTDCIISNNVGYLAPVQSYGRMSRCRVLNNCATNNITGWGSISSCVFSGNTMTGTKRLTAVASYGCTFDTAPNAEYANKQNTYYSLILNRTPAAANTSYLKQTCVDTVPIVAGPDAFDFRLGSLSPAILFGDLSARNDTSTYRLVCDVNGDKLEIKDGRMTVGAVHGGPRAPCVVISNGGVAGATVEGGAFGTNVVRTAGEITLTASATRPLVGFEVNGAFVPAETSSYAFTPATEPGAVTSVSPVYGTDWYVDVIAGSDAAPGGTPATARQTIRSASTNAVSGDVIHVAPGTYGELEGAVATAGRKLRCRVVVPAGVTLVSTEGAEKTVIVGAASDDDEAAAHFGNGPNAIRCVHAEENAMIRGFTLTGGHTFQVKQPDGADDDLNGGAVKGANISARVVDCVVSNNFCYKGTLYNCRVVRSRVTGNSGTTPYNTSHNPTASGSAGTSCGWYGCIIDKNGGSATLSTPSGVYSCTIVDNFNYTEDWTGHESSPQTLYSTKAYAVYNTVLLNGRTYGDLSATNSMFVSNTKTIGSTAAYHDRAVEGHSIFTNSAAMKVDADFTPTFGQYAGIDAGDASYVPDWAAEFADKDIYGNPRVSNGKMDIGAVEYDWRGRYKQDLGPRATSVTAASPEVVETDAGTVRIPSGALVGTLKPGEVQLNFTVTGGTLAVWLGETLVGEFGPSADPQSVKLEPTEANNEFRLAFTPSDADGYAEIARLKGISGMLLLVR